MVSHWSLSDSKCPLISRSLFSFLADLNNAVVWLISTRPLISKSSSSCINRLVTVPKAPIIVSIRVTFMFNNFFNSLAWSVYLSTCLFSFSFNFTLKSAEITKSTIRQVLFCLIISRSGCLTEIRWSICISKCQRSLCASFSRVYSRLCKFNLFVCSNFSFLHNSQWITLPNQSCLVLYSFCANLQHSLIISLFVSALFVRLVRQPPVSTKS